VDDINCEHSFFQELFIIIILLFFDKATSKNSGGNSYILVIGKQTMISNSSN